MINNLMLTQKDAYEIVSSILKAVDIEFDEEIIKNELEQKCWICNASNTDKKLVSLVCDINPAEICSQIQNDNLRDWCETIQANMQLLLKERSKR